MGFFKKLFIHKQSSVGSAAFILMLAVAFSRMLGLFRDRLLVEYFLPEELGVYFAAFRIPNMLFELMVTGVLTTAFIPVFTRLLTKKGEEHALKMASAVINIGVVILIIITIPVLLFTEHISRFLAPGFSEEQISQMAYYTRLMVVFQVFPLMIGNFMTGMLQSYQIFIIPAFAPVLYNLGIIVGIVVFSSTVGLLSPVIGVAIGALLFLLVQIIPVYMMKYRHKWTLDSHVEGVREVGKLMVPRTIGIGVAQIDTTVDLMLASLLGSKMVTIFQFAQHLQFLPVGLFGATIAQAALPTLSRASATEEKEGFRQQLVSAMHQILFFVLPFSVYFIVLRIPITRLAFGANLFDWEATVMTGKTLSAFGISLFAQAIVHVLARGFYALYDTKTPVIIGIISIGLNTFLSILFISYFHLPVWSLGLSTSIASIVQCSLLLLLLQKRVGKFSLNDAVFLPGKMMVAASIMGVVLFILLKLLDQLVFDTTRTINLFFLTSILGILGIIIYVFLAWVFGVGQVYAFLRMFKRIDKIRTRFFPANISLVSDEEQKQM